MPILRHPLNGRLIKNNIWNRIKVAILKLFDK